MKNVWAISLISAAAMSSPALAGGGSTRTVSGFEYRGLTCESPTGIFTRPDLQGIELGDSKTLTLSTLWYDFFYITFEFTGEVNGCPDKTKLAFGNEGLLVERRVASLSACADTQKTLLSVFENADLKQLEDGSVRITTNLNSERICNDAASKVIAVFGG